MKICLVGHLPGRHDRRLTGGSERQLMLLAQGLGARGHDVYCVLPCQGVARWQNHGYSVLPGWSRAGGLPGLRWLMHRLGALLKNLMALECDLYYCRGFSIYAPTVVRAARRLCRHSVVGLGSDTDLNHSAGAGALTGGLLGRLSNGRLASFYFLAGAVRRATWVVAQNRWQYDRCRILGLPVALIKSICEVKDAQYYVREGIYSDVVWVGSLSAWKGLDVLHQLVRVLPRIRFEIVGPSLCAKSQNTIESILGSTNVTWLGEMEHERVLQRIAGARLLVNTSSMEGVSNAMLEAWALRRPVISLMSDPDDLLSSAEPLGACAGGDLGRMVVLVERWLGDPALRNVAGERACSYVRTNHSTSGVCKAYERLVASQEE